MLAENEQRRVARLNLAHNRPDHGCLVDGRFGSNRVMQGILARAEYYGYTPGELPPVDDENYFEALAWDVDSAESYLNEVVAAEDSSFGWYEGDFLYQTDAWWDET